ncbi:class I tRNA ligase family protein [Streptomyces sp. NBC_01455]|uniref:class I tRNA ligase family protein n=1 Tax=Streptomyces sp. NBC_01455 TaxID=2903874 RepID=UPI002E2F0172|nr:class I tRNA ligase family protein [Streptomyces sp. NBC_01455]
MHIHHKVLLVPMQPTPNGRLHIGHGGGTYLRADVIARALRAQGHEVAVVTGSDVYEDWVVAAAHREGRSPEETYRDHHTGIARDLSRLSIGLDAWIDPAGQTHRDAYRQLHEDVLTRLRATGAARMEDERIPYAQDSGRALVGPWIAGECPHCGRPCGGSTCTYCGEYFVPEQLVRARSRVGDSPVEWRTERNWFATADDPRAIADRHRAAGLRPVFLAPLLRALDQHGGRVRLTGQGDWGIRGATLPAGKVISNGYFLYSVYCGEVHRALTGAAVNPFTPGSGVTTVGLFGSDNSTPGLLVPDVIAQGSQGTLAPFDATVVNGMLHFEGHKCSTSKRHGIWLSELLEGTSVSADELRYALLHAPLDHGPADIDLRTLTHHIDALRTWRATVLRPALDRLRERPRPLWRPDPALKAAADQYALLTPYAPDLTRAVTAFDEWIGSALEPDAGWLVGVALLGRPLLPELAGHVWARLGLPGEPGLRRAAHLEPLPPRSPAAAAGPLPGPLTPASLRQYVHLQEPE